MVKVEIKDDLLNVDINGSDGMVLSEILAAIVTYLNFGENEKKLEMIKAILDEVLKYETTKEQVEAILNINKFIMEKSQNKRNS